MPKRLYILLAVLVMAVGMPALAQTEGESPAKQINNIKRNGSYIYAEATAPTEKEAREACDELIKYEISRYVAENEKLSGSQKVIIKNYNVEQQYISMPRGDMTRVFIYVRKRDVEPASNVKTFDKQELDNAKKPEAKQPQPKVDEPKQTVQKPAEAPKAEPKQGVQPGPKPAAGGAAIKSEGTDLRKWQVEMIQEIASSADMTAARRMLNRFKAQNKVKRLGDATAAAPNPDQAFFAYYDEAGKLVALLGPGTAADRHDFISGASVSQGQYAKYKYIWFTIPKQ